MVLVFGRLVWVGSCVEEVIECVELGEWAFLFLLLGHQSNNGRIRVRWGRVRMAQLRHAVAPSPATLSVWSGLGGKGKEETHRTRVLLGLVAQKTKYQGWPTNQDEKEGSRASTLDPWPSCSPPPRSRSPVVAKRPTGCCCVLLASRGANLAAGARERTKRRKGAQDAINTERSLVVLSK